MATKKKRPVAKKKAGKPRSTKKGNGIPKRKQVSKLPPFEIREMQVNDKSARLKMMNTRIAFVSLAEANTNFPPQAFYCVTMLIPKAVAKKVMSAVDRVIKRMLKNSTILKTGGQRTKAYKRAMKLNGNGALFKDGDKMKNKEGKVYDGLEGHISMRAKTGAVEGESGFAPKVAMVYYRRDKTEIRPHELANELYSGIWADVSITLKPYITGDSIGIAIYLGGVMKLKDDKRLGGTDDFEARDDIEDDFETVGGLGGFDEDEQGEEFDPDDLFS